MNPKTVTVLIIAVSLASAAAILVNRLYFSAGPYVNEVVFAIIAFWFIPFSYLATIARKNQRE